MNRLQQQNRMKHHRDRPPYYAGCIAGGAIKLPESTGYGELNFEMACTKQLAWRVGNSFGHVCGDWYLASVDFYLDVDEYQPLGAYQSKEWDRITLNFSRCLDSIDLDMESGAKFKMRKNTPMLWIFPAD